jgi:hypothetical protein
MVTLKVFALAGAVALSASLVSEASADTVGRDCTYATHDSFKSSEWEKVVSDLKTWIATHDRHDPYYYTMKTKLVSAETLWERSRHSDDGDGKRHKRHRECKADVSPS